ncbi:MAG TPA: ATP-binding protein, partial [Actinomycetota bacterium]|nr:ATP-binding protein [Actinomycetota bacterium]
SRSGGTGLGLPIALENARILGGSMSVENLKSGTRFTVRLPLP